MLTSTPLFRSPSSDEVTRHMPLVHQVVARFLRRLPANVLRDDLVAAGTFGLVDSLRKNGGDGGASFEAYARIRIRGAILDELRSQDWLPRRARTAATAQTNAQGNGGSAPSVEIPLSIVALDDLSAYERSSNLVDDSCADALGQLETARENRRMAAAVERLPERERTIVRMHYFQGARFKDIGELLGVSEPRISQLHTRAMSQLRALLGDEAAAA